MSWGDGFEALNLQIAQQKLYTLDKNNRVDRDGNQIFVNGQIKNWRPQILALVEWNQDGMMNGKLFDFLAQLRKGSLLFIVPVIGYLLKAVD